MNRFTLEEKITKILDIDDLLDDLMYMYADAPNPPTEDDVVNMIIGIKSTLNIRYDKLWNTFEQLVKDGTIDDAHRRHTETQTNWNKKTPINQQTEQKELV